LSKVVVAHVAVPDDDVQSSVKVGVRMRLVPGVDDGTRARGRAALPPDVVGTLAAPVLGTARGVQHLAGTADDLPEIRNGMKRSVSRRNPRPDR
jgi:hypothetical protein